MTAVAPFMHSAGEAANPLNVGGFKITVLASAEKPAAMNCFGSPVPRARVPALIIIPGMNRFMF